MINVQAVLRVADNSGAIFAKCIRLLNSSSRVGAQVSDMITVVVKKSIIKKNIKKSKEVKKGQIFKAILLCSKFGVRRWGGFFLRAAITNVALLNKYFLPMGTRLNGVVFRELRSRLNKSISLAQVSL